MIEMQGGEIIVVAGSGGHMAMDFGAMDGRVPPLACANPARFWSNPLGLYPVHMVCPIDYYEPLARTQLRGRLGDFTGESLRTSRATLRRGRTGRTGGRSRQVVPTRHGGPAALR